MRPRHPVSLDMHIATIQIAMMHPKQWFKYPYDTTLTRCVYHDNVSEMCQTMCQITFVFESEWEVGAGVETQKNVRGEIGGWGWVPFNEPYAPSLSTIYDGA